MPIGIYPGTNDVALAGGRRITQMEYRRRRQDHERIMGDYLEKSDVSQRIVDELKREKELLLTHLNVHYKEMTADRVVRVITRTNAPIVGMIRKDDFY